MIRHRPHAGFTIYELMLVMAVAAVILGVAVPSFSEFMRNNRMSGAANDFMTTVHLARSQAVKLHQPTVVCFTTTPDAAAPACNGDGTQGWIAFVDDLDPAVTAATDNNGQVDGAELVLQRHRPLAPLTVRLSPADTDAYIGFGANGFARPLPLGVALDAVVICDDRGNVEEFGADQSAARAVSISPVGRPTTTRSVTVINTLGGCL